MKKSTRGLRVLSVSLGMCILCPGLVLLGTGCPTSQPGCTTNAQCDDGAFCNGAETCSNGLCVAGANPCAQGEDCSEPTDTCLAAAGCETDADCSEGEFCDAQTGECVANASPYETAAFDHDLHKDTMAIACATCHHDDAGFSTCVTCHNRDEVVESVPILKDAMHNPDTGCWQCHNATNPDGTRDCSVCHTALDTP